MRSPATHFFIALAASIGVFVVYGIWYTAVSQKSEEVATLESQIVTASDTINRIASARVALAKVANDEAMVQSYFVTEADVVSFINVLEELGVSQHSKVTVSSVSSGGSSEHPTLLFTVSVAGAFDSVMRTVGTIEYVPYALSVTSLSVREDVKDKWIASLNLSVLSVSATTNTL